MLLRDVVYVQNTSDFVLNIISQRNLDPTTTFVRISVDSGGSFLKVIVNVFDPEERNINSERFMNSGVQRCQILGITEDVPESNHNLRLLLEKLNLEDVKFDVAFDLKCGNAVFGLSSHAGKRACLWCEGLPTAESGTLQSLGSLDYWYGRYAETGFNKVHMKECMNVINPRVLYKDEDPETLLQYRVAPPELHLMIGLVSLLGTVLLDLWTGFDEWLRMKNILQRGYQGRGWDGNNSNTILKHLDELECKVMKTVPHLVPIVQCLKDFRSFKESCFGYSLEPEFEKNLCKLKNSFTASQELIESLSKKLHLTWKVHIILCHVAPFVKYHNCGLGQYAEQCGEAIHSKFKPTWARFKRTEGHSEQHCVIF